MVEGSKDAVGRGFGVRVGFGLYYLKGAMRADLPANSESAGIVVLTGLAGGFLQQWRIGGCDQ